MRLLIAIGLLSLGAQPLAQAPVTAGLRRVWADSLTDISGAVSRDGRSLTFINWDTYDIEVLDLASNQRRRITANRLGGAAQPLSSAFSPDGRSIAYTVTPTDSVFAVQIVSDRGGEPRTVYRGPGTFAAVSDWTPDGQGIVAVHSRDARAMELGIVSVVDGTFRVLATGRGLGHARVSPNGKLVVFEEWTRDNPAVRNLRIVPVAGGSTRILVGGADDWSPEWAPNGEGVLFVSARGDGRGLWYVAVDDRLRAGPVRRLAALDADMTTLGVTDNGTVFLGAEGQGLTTYTAGMRWPEAVAERITPVRTPGFRDARRAVFSPDSRSLAYLLKPRSYVTRPGWLTPAVRSLTTDSTRLYPTQLTLRDAPEWFADGRALLFVVDQAGSGEGAGPPWTFWRLDLNTGAYRQVGAASAQGLVRVVGLTAREFLYKRNDFSKHPAESAVEAVDLRTGATRTIYQTTGDVIANAALSRNGEHVAIAVTDSMRRTTLSVLSAGSAPRVVARLRTTNARAQLMWFADDQAILISGQIGTEPGLWRIPADGSAPQKVQVDASQMTEARLSPDGRYLAYTVRGKEPSEIWALDNVVDEIHKSAATGMSRRPHNER